MRWSHEVGFRRCSWRPPMPVPPSPAIAAPPRIALVSRELWPLGGGGIGRYVAETATLLGGSWDVTILTSNEHAPALADARAVDDPRVTYGGARVAFVTAPGPNDTGGFTSSAHLYAARVVDRLRELYPEGGPQVVEVGDFLGEGAVVVQARRAGDPLLEDTDVLVRLHTSGEMAAAMNGFAADDPETRAVFALERLALRDADGLLAADAGIVEAYREFYGATGLAPAAMVPHAFGLVAEKARPDASGSIGVSGEAGGGTTGPLRILCLGRLERRKGQDDLVEALLGMPGPWSLSLAGGDTRTGPLGTSVEQLVHRRAAGDPRVRLLGRREPHEIPGLLSEHDLLVVPSRWECWPYVVLEAMREGVPVLAVAAGGPARMCADADVAWLARSGAPADLRQALAPLVDAPDIVRSRRGPRPRSWAGALADPEPIAAAYTERLRCRPRETYRSRSAPRQPLVSVVVPYHGLPEHVEAAVVSVLSQTHERVEVLVVNDGSFAAADRVLAHLASRYPLTVLTQPNRGLGAARNLGIGQARGRYVLPLDADNELEPQFVERCLRLLRHDPDCAYVTSWTRYVDERGDSLAGGVLGYQPLGNGLRTDDRENVAGDAVALIPRATFDHLRFDPALTSYEDWSFYRRLARLGMRGRVVPERLVRYRVRPGSLLRAVGLPNHERLLMELRSADQRDGIF